MKVLVGMLAVSIPALSLAEGFECLMEPSQVVELRASVEGEIVAVHVQRGDVLRKGQVLVELQSAAEKVAVELAGYRAKMEGQVEMARTRLDFANKKLTRVMDLEQNNFVSPQARDEADAERALAASELLAAIESRELAELEFRRAQEQLALRTLSSPFAGVVVDRLLNPGDLAEAGTGRKPILEIAQIDPLKVDVVVPAALYGRITVGQSATVLSAVSGAEYQAKVKIVDRVIDAASDTFVVRLDLPNPQLRLPVGSRCTAEFEVIAAPVTNP